AQSDVLELVNSHLLPVVKSVRVFGVVLGLALHRGCSVALREMKAGKVKILQGLQTDKSTSATRSKTKLYIPRFFLKSSSGRKTEVVGLECVLMAESETECDTPGLDTLGSECVIAHSHVDLHYGAETEIMTEEKRGLELEIHGSDLKIQGLGTDLGAVACVDAIVAETDHDYIKVEHGEMHCFTGAEIKTTGNEALLGEVLLKTEKERHSPRRIYTAVSCDALVLSHFHSFPNLWPSGSTGNTQNRPASLRNARLIKPILLHFYLSCPVGRFAISLISRLADALLAVPLMSDLVIYPERTALWDCVACQVVHSQFWVDAFDDGMLQVTGMNTQPGAMATKPCATRKREGDCSLDGQVSMNPPSSSKRLNARKGMKR
ncbi:hypothetical protein INR49_021757, partial [Caranx melampygus]